MDIRLSKDFWLSEFTRSSKATADGLCTGQVLCIEPSSEQIDRLRALCSELLQPLRDRVGPLRVTSGLRSPDLNAALKGSATSAHLSGDGADVAPARVRPVAIMEVLEDVLEDGVFSFDQAILYPGHVHLGLYHPMTRQQRRELRVAKGGAFPAWRRAA